MTQAIQVRHVGIVVKDLDRSLWFYQGLLGLDLAASDGGERSLPGKGIGLGRR